MPVMLLIGVTMGVLLTAMCVANSNEERGKKWWDE